MSLLPAFSRSAATMPRLEEVDFANGERSIGLLYSGGRIVHQTNYGAERISKADRTQPDTSSLGGRSIIALPEDSYVLTAAHEAPIHRVMVDYYRDVLGLPTVPSNHILSVPAGHHRVGANATIADFVKPVCQSMAEWVTEEPSALRPTFHGATYMVPFISNDRTALVADHFGLLHCSVPQSVEDANNKKYLPAAAEEFGFLTPPTLQPFSLMEAAEQFDELMAIAAENSDDFEGKIWVKLCRSSGGEGTVPFEHKEDMLSWLQENHQGRDFADAMVDPAFNEGIVLQLGVRGRSKDPVPNYNFFVGDSPENARDLGGSAQVIKNQVFHVGNNGMLPEADREKINPVVKKVADWLRAIGYQDICGIDVVMGANGKVWVIDINARWNASTSTTILHNDFKGHLGTKYFRYAGKVDVPAEIDPNDYFAHLLARGAQFSLEKGGVIPINFMTAHRPDLGEAHVNPMINVAIYAPNEESLQYYYELAQMPRGKR